MESVLKLEQIKGIRNQLGFLHFLFMKRHGSDILEESIEDYRIFHLASQKEEAMMYRRGKSSNHHCIKAPMRTKESEIYRNLMDSISEDASLREKYLDVVIDISKHHMKFQETQYKEHDTRKLEPVYSLYLLFLLLDLSKVA